MRRAPRAAEKTDMHESSSLDSSSNHGQPSRGFIGVRFECCGIYQRIYRHATKPEYRGRCPKCLREVIIPIGSGGTSCRLFTAS